MLLLYIFIPSFSLSLLPHPYPLSIYLLSINPHFLTITFSKVGCYYDVSMFPMVFLIWDLSTDNLHRNSTVQYSQVTKLAGLLYTYHVHPNWSTVSFKSGICKEALRGARTTRPSHQAFSATIVHISQHFQSSQYRQTPAEQSL